MPVKLDTVQQALALPEGRLVAYGCIEASFTDRNVYDCAKLITEAGDETEFFSQAEVVAHAGNNYGWGQGQPYRTF